LCIVLQYFKRHDQIKSLCEREEILHLEFNGASLDGFQPCMLSNQFSVQIETKPSEAPPHKIFKESATTDSDFQETTGCHALEEPVREKTPVQISQSGVRRVRQFGNRLRSHSCRCKRTRQTIGVAWKHGQHNR